MDRSPSRNFFEGIFVFSEKNHIFGVLRKKTQLDKRNKSSNDGY
jgi:hypothetical protein